MSRNIVLMVFAALVSGVPAATTHAQRAPKVGEISANELYQLVQQRAQQVEDARQAGTAPAPANFVIVDVREPAEYRVSMIPGAIPKSEFEKNINAYASMTVIPYCTLGGRSSRYAEQLAAKGYQVINFRESIIGWCRAKLPLVTPDGQATQRVHTNGASEKLPEEYRPVK